MIETLGHMQIKPAFLEPHYKVKELAEAWGVGGSTIRRWFYDEPGVLKFGPGAEHVGKRRNYVSLRIPAHVAQRVYDRHVRGSWRA